MAVGLKTLVYRRPRCWRYFLRHPAAKTRSDRLIISELTNQEFRRQEACAQLLPITHRSGKPLMRPRPCPASRSGKALEITGAVLRVVCRIEQ